MVARRFSDSPLQPGPAWPDTWFEPEAPVSEASGASRPGHPSEPDSLTRVAIVYVRARVVLAATIMALLVVLTLTGTPLPLAMWWLTGSYAACALAVWWLTVRPPSVPLGMFSAPWFWLTIGLDLLHFGALDLMAPSGLIATPLMALPVLMAGVFWQRVEALGMAAGVALFLLFRAFSTDQGGEVAALLQARAGLAGLAVMAIAWFSNVTTRRLLLLEQQGRDSEVLARQQAQIRRLVIDELDEGVLVVDRRGRLRAMNPATSGFLGLASASQAIERSLVDDPAWQPLAEAVERGYVQGDWPESGRLVCLRRDDQVWRLIVRIRFTRTPHPSARSDPSSDSGGHDRDLCVMLLEDERVVQARIQQEKLAAMGRMSAGMAHDIRNPLAAIAQASALLGEIPLPPGSDRLLKIIDTQAERLSRWVTDVLDAVVSTPADTRPLDLGPWVAAVVRDWCQGKGLPASACELLLPADASAVVQCDGEHLRRILFNLLDNAWQHGRGRPGSVRLTLREPSAFAGSVLSIWNDGARLSPEVEARLFEPFFSTRSQGTGLGLFLSRELCHRNGATLHPISGHPPEGYSVGFAVTFDSPN